MQKSCNGVIGKSGRRPVYSVGFLLAAFSLHLYFILSAPHSGAAIAIQKTSAAESTDRIVPSYGHLPLGFEANRGQADPSVKFLSRGNGYRLYLTDGEAVLALKSGESKAAIKTNKMNRPGKEKEARLLRMKFVGAHPHPNIEGRDPLPGKTNYFIGKDRSRWHADIPTYAKIEYQNIYHGVDLIFYGDRKRLEYDFVVSPGADPKSIQLAFDGSDPLRIDPDGSLILRYKKNEQVRLLPPAVYQEKEGVREPVAGRYLLKDKKKVSFQIAAYDRNRPLIIDPVLSYSTYLGGDHSETGSGIAVDSSGNVYVTGSTASTDFPIAPGARQPAPGGGACLSSTGLAVPCDDLFVAKLNSAGSALLYSTYIGGSNTDRGSKIAVDSSGNSYITGETNSQNFPITAGAFQPEWGGGECGTAEKPLACQDAFILKLNPSGNALLYSTYLGGSGADKGIGLAVDASGNSYIAGFAAANNFPVTPGAFQTAHKEGASFIAKLNATGTALIYSTFLGESNIGAQGIAVDPSGNVYVTGAGIVPITPGAFQTTIAGGNDAFLTKLNPTGTGLIYSTYIGGSGEEIGYGIAVDPTGHAYLAGSTTSDNFPTANPIQGNCAPAGACRDAFVAKLNPAGTALIYSTYLGGRNGEKAFAVALDRFGNAYSTGETDSPDFPTVNSIQSSSSCTPDVSLCTDAFVAKINPAGTKWVYSTYLGGSGINAGKSIAVDATGNAYLAGLTDSKQFPTTAGAFQTVGGEGRDAFVTKIGNLPPLAKIAASPTAGAPPLKVHLDGTSSSDPDGTVASYLWDFGDGLTASGATVDHTYSSPGSFTATLTVTDDAGAKGSSSTQIEGSNVQIKVSDVLFNDDFNRTTGLGADWTAYTGSVTTDGAYAVSSGLSNFVGIVPRLGTDDYTVESLLSVPAGSLYSGIIARGNTATGFRMDLYAAQISTRGTLNLYRRNGGTWTLLKSAPAAIVAGKPYTVKLKVAGSNPVSLELFLNGISSISYADSSSARILSGIPGIENYDPGVKVDRFTVYSNGAASVNRPPAAKPAANPTSGTAPLSVHFDGSGSSDPDGSIVSYRWNFGDGASATGATANHTYSSNGSYLVQLTVTDNGGLTSAANLTVQAGSLPSPRFVYVANSESNDLTTFKVNLSNGTLTKVGSVAAGTAPYTVAVDPKGRFVYAGNFGSNNVSMYKINPSTGALTSIGVIPTGIGPFSIAVEPSGKFVYVANQNGPTDVWIYAINQTTGALTSLGTIAAGVSPINITVDPLGRFVYVANNSSNNISVFTRNSSTGLLTRKGEVAAGAQPNSVAVHHSGKYAYAANYISNDIFAYRIDPTSGLLTQFSAIAAGSHPFSMAIAPSGQFVYVAHSSSNDVRIYRVDIVTGALTSVGSAPAGLAPRSIILDAAGRFAYVANLNSSDISVYAVNPSSGLLTPVGRFPAGTRSRSVAIAEIDSQAAAAICPGRTRTPYIAFDTSTSATLAFECAVPTATVEWGVAPNYTDRIDRRPGSAVEDNFNRADATSLGGGWAESIADFGIAGNQVTNLDAASQQARTTVPLGPDQTVSVDCLVKEAGNSCGVIARWSDLNNYYYARLDAGQKNIFLYKKVGGTFTSLGSVTRSLSYGTLYRLRLAVNQSRIELFFADEAAPVIAATDTALPAGDFAGFHSSATAPRMTAFDNFSAQGKGGTKRFVTLQNLSPDTLYSYRVSIPGSSGGALGQGTFRTAKPAGDNKYSFVVFGDSGEGSSAQRTLASLMERLSFSFGIITGDVIYESGADFEFDPRYFTPYKNLIGRLPFFPVAGNHDVITDSGATFMSNFYHPTGKLYYDFRWGDTHFIALDSTRASFHTPDPGQLGWLARTLAASTARWKIIFFHHPPYNSGTYGNDANAQRDFVPLFEKYHVDVVFTGHAHDYERTNTINGVTYFVTGGGGAGLTASGRSSFTAVSRSIYHLLMAKMDTNTFTVQALDAGGAVFDSVTITK